MDIEYKCLEIGHECLKIGHVYLELDIEHLFIEHKSLEIGHECLEIEHECSEIQHMMVASKCFHKVKEEIFVEKWLFLNAVFTVYIVSLLCIIEK